MHPQLPDLLTDARDENALAMADTGLTSEFVHKLKEEKERYTSKLTNGHPKSFDEYKHLVGIIEGLVAAERILHETIQMYMELQDAD